LSHLLEARDLRVRFEVNGGFLGLAKSRIEAVGGVSFHVDPGEIVGLVGESGCGKTTIGRALVGLTRSLGGSILFRGEDLASMPSAPRFQARGSMGIVFQDPYSSLSPRMTISEIISEPLRTHTAMRGAELRSRTLSLLEQVGLSEAQMDRFPSEFSGGQRQRIAIARAISLSPAFMILDEPTSALDVSVQAQVLNLLRDLHRELGLAYLFISHDLIVVRYLAHRLMVMYCGRVVEEGDCEEILARPAHPYTRALVSAIPLPDPTVRGEGILLKGTIPSPSRLPIGCAFSTRCPEAKVDACHRLVPELKTVGLGRSAACHRLAGP
jgi:oligopeptide transport system ATP-binding protein